MDEIKGLQKKINSSKKVYDKKIELFRPDELVDDYVDSIVRAKKFPLSFGMPKLDNELRGDLRGKIGALIGYGGTRKSLFCLNMVNYNAYNHKSTAIYSTMEMSYNAMLSRLLDYSVNTGDENASVSAWNNIDEKTSEDYRKFLKESFTNFYADSILMNQKNGMTYNDYKKLIKRGRELNPGIDILAVDGLSMMGGNGSEREKVDENTMMLKELAKEENIFIPLICHASRGETKHCRSLFDRVRGSEKIIDNVDLAFTCSLVQSNEVDYNNQLGYIRLWNKRDSGNIVDVVYDFDCNKLRMTQSHLEPFEVEINDNSGNLFT